MRWLNILLLCVIQALPCTATVRAAGDGTFRVFDWVGRPYWNKQDRQFDRCAAQTTNADKITIIYSLDSRYVWTLELSNPSWKFNKGASLDIAIGVGNGNFLRVRAIAAEAQLLRVQLPDSLSLFESLRKIFKIEIVAGGMTSRFDLIYDNQVLMALTQCVLRYGTSARSRAAMAGWIKSSAAAGISRHDAAVHKEAEAVGASIMRAAEMPKGSKLAPKEIGPGVSGDAFWSLGKIVFSLTVVQRDQAPEIKTVPAVIVGADAQRCRGDFFSAALPGTIDTLQIARVFTNCLTQETVKSAYYLAVPRKLGGIYLVTIIASDVDIINSEKLTATDIDRRIRGSIAVALEKVDQTSSSR